MGKVTSVDLGWMRMHGNAQTWAGAEIEPLGLNMTEVQSSIHAVSRLQRDYSQNIL